eukprot:c22926_g1_i2 orf=390-2018(+)
MSSSTVPWQLVSQSSLGREGSSGSLVPLEQDDINLEMQGLTKLSGAAGSERALQEFLQESALGTMDDHLVEFSEALRTVARALRSVAESKAHALGEAAEWKRKYEFECLRNLQHNKVNDEDSLMTTSSENSVQELKLIRLRNGHCCGKDDICSQEILKEKDANSNVPNSDQCGKVLFTLAWGVANEKSRHHKHDVVSFESGNIRTAVRSSKQIILEWDSPPQSVFILTKPNSPPVQNLCNEMARWLKEEKGITVFVEPRVKKELSANADFNFVRSWESDEEILHLHTKVDLVITLGGDGTVLWAASMFKGPVPPVVSFSMGSLGFMTPFQSDHYKECLQTVMKGPVHITLRNRLQCRIIRACENEGVGDGQKKTTQAYHLVLNEVSIDRGASPFLTYLEVYCDNYFVTSVQGDGLILSTTSGSTAYSLAAGGSMVHPQVPGILFTPICPHSLSFRPLILPEYVTIRVQVPLNNSKHAWASFDGKDREQLKPGDALLCCMSLYPVPTACEEESTHDFLRSVREGLHWNLRKLQSVDRLRDGLY